MTIIARHFNTGVLERVPLMLAYGLMLLRNIRKVLFYVTELALVGLHMGYAVFERYFVRRGIRSQENQDSNEGGSFTFRFAFHGITAFHLVHDK